MTTPNNATMDRGEESDIGHHNDNGDRRPRIFVADDGGCLQPVPAHQRPGDYYRSEIVTAR